MHKSTRLRALPAAPGPARAPDGSGAALAEQTGLDTVQRLSEWTALER